MVGDAWRVGLPVDTLVLGGGGEVVVVVVVCHLDFAPKVPDLC